MKMTCSQQHVMMSAKSAPIDAGRKQTAMTDQGRSTFIHAAADTGAAD